MAFAYLYAECSQAGQISVAGSVTNNAGGPYSLQFTVRILSGGSVIDTASASVSRLASGERRSFTATGRCATKPAPGISPSTQIDSITPG